MKKINLRTIERCTGGRIITGSPGGAQTGTSPSDIDEIFISGVSTNSREIAENSLFVAIPGERVDGHSYVKSAFENGASAALISKEIPSEDIPEGKVCVLTDNTLEALQKLAAWYRSTFNIPVVAVTGSVGKTSTKEMIAAALETEKRVLKTKGNMNSQIGVALMMFELDDDYDIAVIEMGISEKHEMIKITSIAKPEVAAVTNIGVSHIGNLGSRENIRHEKLDIIKGFPEKNNLLLVPGNDSMLDAYDKLDNEGMAGVNEVIWYGESDFCKYRAKNIRNENDHALFDLYIGDKYITDVTLSVMGIHNVYNALAAIAVADHYSLDIKNAAKGLSSYTPIAMRGQIFENEGITIIDDTYNASPDSMKSGLSVLWDKQCTGRRIAVLADVLELGELSQELHRSVGKYISDKAISGQVTDLLITVGTEAAYIADEAKASGIAAYSYDSREEAYNHLKTYLEAGDLVLVKGSRGMQMDKLVKKLRGEDE